MPTLHSKLRHDLNHYFRAQDIAILPVAETQDTSLQTLLASDGLGLAPLSEVGDVKGLKAHRAAGGSA